MELFKRYLFPGINPLDHGYVILLMYCRIQFTSSLLRIFASMVISDISP